MLRLLSHLLTGLLAMGLCASLGAQSNSSTSGGNDLGSPECGCHCGPCPINIPADIDYFGRGTAGCDGVPPLTIAAPPVIDTTIEIMVGNRGQATAMCGLFWSMRGGYLHVPWLGGTFYSLPPWESVDTVMVPPGGLTIPCYVANDCGAVGLDIYLQVLCADPCAPMGISFSRGVKLTIGV